MDTITKEDYNGLGPIVYTAQKVLTNNDPK